MTLKCTSVIKRAKGRLSRCDSDKDSEVCNLIIIIILIVHLSVCYGRSVETICPETYDPMSLAAVMNTSHGTGYINTSFMDRLTVQTTCDNWTLS